MNEIQIQKFNDELMEFMELLIDQSILGIILPQFLWEKADQLIAKGRNISLEEFMKEQLG